MDGNLHPFQIMFICVNIVLESIMSFPFFIQYFFRINFNDSSRRGAGVVVTNLMGLALATRPVASFWNEMGLVHGYDELN